VTVFAADTNPSQTNPVPGSVAGDTALDIDGVAPVTVTVPLVHWPALNDDPPTPVVVPVSCVLCAYCAVRFATGVVLVTVIGAVPVARVEVMAFAVWKAPLASM
jgi:hypothetical protein